jgi:uncharacterized membrane protein
VEPQQRRDYNPGFQEIGEIAMADASELRDKIKQLEERVASLERQDEEEMQELVRAARFSRNALVIELGVIVVGLSVLGWWLSPS